ncbi:hypothetical protein GCM10009738_10560 [Kitasatospora viridis]|uniref:Uncharacterized protein n=1 Tax=Kitasatospora viridis TaxID=281105 RepID=A0A561TSG3_9ACTN|nr:hypothetical protein FHX73_1395 [Kitasatospora viridis]
MPLTGTGAIVSPAAGAARGSGRYEGVGRFDALRGTRPGPLLGAPLPATGKDPGAGPAIRIPSPATTDCPP